MNKKDDKRTIHNENGQYFENVDIGKGDFVNRDKTDRSIHVGGDMDHSVASSGDTAQITMDNRQASDLSKTEIQALLGDLKSALQSAPVDADIKESVQSDVKVVEAQLEKPEPKKAILLPKAKAILETIKAAATTAVATHEAWPKIVELATKLVEWAKALF